MPPMPRLLLLISVLIALLAATGCGSGSSSTSTSTSAEGSSAAKPAAPGGKKTKPKVQVPKGAPPKQLVTKDLEAGTGPAAEAGDRVTVQYVGVDYQSGKEFDASWDRGEPFSFTLGGGEVIPGWDQGVEGMKVGGRRELIIPPELAYGAAGAPPAIPPNETLVFVVDLEKVG
jgi:peptidylprolyl isomerase